VFTDTLYAILAKKLVCGAVPAAALATVRDAQQSNGGWNFNGDPTGTDLDIDTSALAIETLVAGGAGPSDPNVHAALTFLADNQQADGAWQSFGSDDPNSTSLAILGITATGFDVTSSCWRDTVEPAKAGSAYAGPDAWLESQQQSDGRIQSPNDGFGINTFATSQTVEGLLRSWLPIVRASAPTCAVVPTPPPTEPPIAVAGEVVTVQPTFTG
jgi:hypothetical protein